MSGKKEQQIDIACMPENGSAFDQAVRLILAHITLQVHHSSSVLYRTIWLLAPVTICGGWLMVNGGSTGIRADASYSRITSVATQGIIVLFAWMQKTNRSHLTFWHHRGAGDCGL